MFVAGGCPYNRPPVARRPRGAGWMMTAVRTEPSSRGARRPRLPRALRLLGPGLVAGASDNDPTTVATVAVVGSTTGYLLGWLALLLFPMLAVVQIVAARIGTVTRRSLGDLVIARYGPLWSGVFVISVVPVTILTLAADLKAGAGALALLSGLDLRWFVVPLGLLALAIPMVGSYGQVRRVLQFFALAFLAYVVAALAAKPNWTTVLHDSFIPSIHWSSDYVKGALALLGTTLTSYVYVWETIELSEESDAPMDVRDAQLDAAFGAFFVVVVFWFILIATAATLGVHHHEVQTAEDAARALRPFAGQAASALFGVGLLASALLVLPVLMATTAYLIGSQRDWPRGITRPPSQAPAFYGAMTAAVAGAVGVSFLDVSPIKILFLASIAGGVATPVSLLFLLLIGRDRVTMGQKRVSLLLSVGGYAVAVTVTALALAALLVG
jgi:Mn2+/Fe2+ NRAMP family transporter